jgi:hypothetical protein
MQLRREVVALALFGLGLLSANLYGQDEIAAEIGRTNAPLVIDGVGDEAAWASATPHGTDEFFELETPLDGDEDLQVTWKALWDDENLYVLIEVNDDEIINFEALNWEDDSLEIYIDAQNLDEPEYNPTTVQGIPAYQFTAIAGQEPIDDTTTLFTHGINSYECCDGQYPVGSDTGAMVWSEDPGFYSFEVAFPWVALEETPANIQQRGEFGFGIAINDDDDGGARDTQIMWATELGDLWHVASSFPSVALVGAGPGPGDFNSSGALDAADLDDLTGQSAGGTNPAAYDLNADALVNSTDVQVWVKDLFNSWIGDANLDGQFNSSDLVAVLASGTYEANVDAVWSTGDFNGDGRANSGDLVAALADGGYEVGPRAAAAAVPEPAAIVLCTLGIGVLLARCRRR